MTPPMRLDVAAWPVPDIAARLPAHDAVVVTSRLADDDALLADALAVLDREERQRYDSYANATVARRFALGRAILRGVLGAATNVAPAEVPLHTGLHGKPKLTGASNGPWFSIAHSEDLYVVALSTVGEVGIDVERHRAIEQWERVADRVLDANERLQLAAEVGAGEEPGRVFLRHWCRVEAELKAVGSGIAGLEAHRAGRRPAGLRLAECETLPLPGTEAGVSPRYQLAVALCSPSRDSEFQMTDASAQASSPVTIPATASMA